MFGIGSICLTCSLMKATLQASSCCGFDVLVLATGTFITLDAADDVPLDILRL